MPVPVLAYINAIRWPSAIPAGPFTANFMSAVARAGVETHVIVRSATKQFNGRNGNGKEVLRHEYGIDPPENLHVHVLKTPNWKPASDRVVFFERINLLLGKLRKKYGVNIVMSRDTRSLPYLVRWRKRGFVTIHDSHNYYADLSLRDDLKGKRWERYQRFEQKCLPKINGLLALLDTQAEYYRKSFPDLTVEVAHPGLGEINPPNPNRFDHKTIGYVGALSGKKGMDELLEAFQQLNLPDGKVLFIGGRTSGEKKRMAERLERMNLKDRVEVTGWVTVPEMRKRMNEVTIATLPLHDTFYSRYLTAPSKLFDYLSQAIPVITSDHPSVHELAGDAAVYVPPNDVNALATAINTLLSDREKYDAVVAAAHERAQHLHWDRRGEKTKEFLEALLV